MVNPKCVMCDTYITEVELKSSGEPYKTCKKCRERKNKSTIKEDENDDEKISIDKADETNLKINGVIYEIKRKVIDKELAIKFISDYNIKNGMENENVEIPEYCFNYVIGMKEKTYDYEDKNITETKKLPVWTPDSNNTYIKCSSCKCYNETDCFGVRKSGLPYKTCKNCRSKKPDSESD